MIRHKFVYYICIQIIYVCMYCMTPLNKAAGMAKDYRISLDYSVITDFVLPFQFCIYIGELQMDFQDVAFLPSRAPTTFWKMLVGMKASGPPHVAKL